MIRFLPAVAVVFGATSPVMAQEPGLADESDMPADTIQPEESQPEPDRISVDMGAGLVSEYVSRGIVFAKEPSLQPYVTVSLNLPAATGGAITHAGLFVGNWNSVKLGSIPPGKAGQLTRFYESDFYAGAKVELAGRWTISATYYRYTSLGKSFKGYNDLELIVGFDDGNLWNGAVPVRNFSLSPSLRLVQEAGRPGRPDALYVQPSLTPSFDLGPSDRPVHVAIPLVVGLSDTYYDNAQGGHETFGFFKTGLTLSLAPLPDKAPALNLSGGVDVWLLNDRVLNALRQHRVVGRIGIGWSF